MFAHPKRTPVAQNHHESEVIRQHLEAILGSRTFAGSLRLKQFLRFVVTRALAGEGDCLKEFVIANAVYNRDVSYDPQVDSTVRVEAIRLRTKLRDYYRGEGANSVIEIQLPKGTYVPLFIHHRTADQQPAMEMTGALNF